MGQLLEWFRDSGFANFVAALLSVVAIIISIIALRKSHKTQGRLVDIETARERDRLLKARKAALVARIVTEGARSIQEVSFLVIENRGEAAARCVWVVLDGTPFGQHPACVEELADDLRIGPSSDARFVLAINNDCMPPFDLQLAWQDDSGEPGVYRSTLTH